jgi:antitoxin component YwqK of YwqJK toxin-antitoxin module
LPEQESTPQKEDDNISAKLHQCSEELKSKAKKNNENKATAKAAKEAGASRSYVAEVKKIKTENPGAYEEIKAGTKTIQDIKSEDKKKKLEEKKQEIIGDTAKEIEGNYKDGKEYGLFTTWYENGQKLTEANYKNGKEVIKID